MCEQRIDMNIRARNSDMNKSLTRKVSNVTVTAVVLTSLTTTPK